MKRLLCLFLFLLLFPFSISLDTDLMINTVEAISKVYHYQYYLILSSYERVQNVQHEKLLKTLHSRLKLSTIVNVHIDDFHKYEEKMKGVERWKKMNTESRSLIIFNGGNSADRKKFVKFSEHVNFGGSLIWLIFLADDESFGEFVNSLILPFNSQLILAVMKGSKNVHFKAPYRVAKNFSLRITDVGKYSYADGLNLPVIDVAMLRQDMEGFRLRTGTKLYPPALTFEYDKNGKKTPVGRVVDVWQEVSERLNFTYDFYFSNVSGSKLPNGSWNGLMGMMINDEIDVVVMHLTITKDRIDYVDFSVPIMSTGNKIFYLDVQDRFEWGNLFRPFSIEVWLVILLWFVVISIALTYFFTAEYSRVTKNSLTEHKRECTISECLLIAFRACTNQGTDVTPESISCRIVFYMAYLTMAVILPAYSAALISYLTIQTPYKPFDSLETMLQKRTHYLAVSLDTSDYSYFADGVKDKKLRDVYQKLIMPLKIQGLHVRNSEEGIDLVCHRKNIAFIGNYIMGRMHADKLLRKYGCVINSLESAVTSTDESWAFQKGSPYALIINLELKKMTYKGLVRRLQKQLFDKSKNKYNSSGYEEINIRHVIQIYSLLLGGFILSVLILTVEIFIKHRKKNKVTDVNGCEIPKKVKSKFVIRKIKSKFLVKKVNSKLIIREVKSKLSIQKIKYE